VSLRELLLLSSRFQVETFPQWSKVLSL